MEGGVVDAKEHAIPRDVHVKRAVLHALISAITVLHAAILPKALLDTTGKKLSIASINFITSPVHSDMIRSRLLLLVWSLHTKSNYKLQTLSCQARDTHAHALAQSHYFWNTHPYILLLNLMLRPESRVLVWGNT